MLTLSSIVAVHGLRSHPINSWIKDGVMWLYDLLPTDLPNARIMTYGYNSNLAEDATTGRIRDFAKGLLNDLDNYRTEEVCANADTLSFFFFFRPAKH